MGIAEHDTPPLDTAPATPAPNWIDCGTELPPDNLVVLTKIDDGRGVRMVEKLRRDNGLWWFEDKTMYVYYSPTHWSRL